MCRKHPKYQALRRPTADCLECWMDWLENPVHREQAITVRELRRIMARVVSHIRVTETRLMFSERILLTQVERDCISRSGM